MEKNVGEIDRIIRFVAGIILLYLAFTLDNKILVIILSALAGISILEGFTGFCGLYKMFNINTGGK
ncbi:MAG: hypothetical protein QT11_C0001G0645 [archaeon GW2011_AR20]|nr:MAG: hypothetical protein QT11_C0001G0645 [archaeon GW2011_AR20]MBS3160916.1 DUF2892 domain-containing protein [Candidatus Woesearchaeota archaeon]